MEEEKKFVELLQHNLADYDQIDDYIEKWHKSSSSLELHDFLGMSFEEYSCYVTDRTSLKKLFPRNKYKQMHRREN